MSKVDKRFWIKFLSNLASVRATGATSQRLEYPLDFGQTLLPTVIWKMLLSNSSRNVVTVLLKLPWQMDFLDCTKVLAFQYRESLYTKSPIMDVTIPLRDYCQIQKLHSKPGWKGSWPAWSGGGQPVHSKRLELEGLWGPFQLKPFYDNMTTQGPETAQMFFIPLTSNAFLQFI